MQSTLLAACPGSKSKLIFRGPSSSMTSPALHVVTMGDSTIDNLIWQCGWVPLVPAKTKMRFLGKKPIRANKTTRANLSWTRLCFLKCSITATAELSQPFSGCARFGMFRLLGLWGSCLDQPQPTNTSCLTTVRPHLSQLTLGSGAIDCGWVPPSSGGCALSLARCSC